MLDFGFVIVMIAVVIPFLWLLLALQWKRRQQQQQAMLSLMKRVGLDARTEKTLVQKMRRGPNFGALQWLATQLKMAGLLHKKIVVRLIVIQATLLFFSAYMLSTRWQQLDEKGILMAFLLPFFPMIFVWMRKKQRQNKIRQQFPEMLDAITRALQAGYGMDGALNMIGNDFPAPLGQEVKEVNRQLTLGISMREILREFQRRIDLQEAQFFVVTLIIQRETGGQLAAILDELSKVMRRREGFQAKLKTMTAESRFTAWFIGGAPVLYLGYKYFFDRDSMAFFLQDPVGQQMLLVSLVLIATGALLLKSMLRMKF